MQNTGIPFYKKRSFISLVIAALVIIFIGGGFIKTSNGLATKQQDVEAQLGQVQTVLQRRADLIPNLVNAVKGQQKQEKEVYGEISKARTEYYNSQKKYNSSNNTNDKVNALDEQSKSLNVLVGSIKEAYPNLTSSNTMHDLIVQMEGTENRISVERNKYNRVAREYNNKIVKFPGSLVAGMTGHSKVNYFSADTNAQKAPTVNF
ncbi:LemA family protein [Apilactobacillus xinyiensis]|uniref:LemA family protein n=1 Tax=Apilactobacillus xinyiensis TaxID=2841032 RepID=A0ABT0I1C3_9LACO|nr:LemA family protein [Apilactobacillus xinyiensis]MCK8624515.1 LemA family protein [Apilactobacillus xinyiensis]MCL0318618.1 LemA family protein [Apilactobacillus xinyiensis]MCL0330778.1 LemA family protein [Apilactobacillus xinyiensis]